MTCPLPDPIVLVEDLRILVFYRREQAKELNRQVNRLHADLAQISPGYQHKITTRLTLPTALTPVMRLMSTDRSVRADIARGRVRNMRGLITQIKQIDTRNWSVGQPDRNHSHRHLRGGDPRRR